MFISVGKGRKQREKIKMALFNATATPNDGNAYSVMGSVQKAMKSAGATKEELATYWEEATAGDYDNLIQVSMRYVELEG